MLYYSYPIDEYTYELPLFLDFEWSEGTNVFVMTVFYVTLFKLKNNPKVLSSNLIDPISPQIGTLEWSFIEILYRK